MKLCLNQVIVSLPRLLTALLHKKRGGIKSSSPKTIEKKQTNKPFAQRNTLLETTWDQLSHWLCSVCQAPSCVLTEREGNAVNATVITSLARDGTMLQRVCVCVSMINNSVLNSMYVSINFVYPHWVTTLNAFCLFLLPWLCFMIFFLLCGFIWPAATRPGEVSHRFNIRCIRGPQTTFCLLSLLTHKSSRLHWDGAHIFARTESLHWM